MTSEKVCNFFLFFFFCAAELFDTVLQMEVQLRVGEQQVAVAELHCAGKWQGAFSAQISTVVLSVHICIYWHILLVIFLGYFALASVVQKTSLMQMLDEVAEIRFFLKKVDLAVEFCLCCNVTPFIDLYRDARSKCMDMWQRFTLK